MVSRLLELRQISEKQYLMSSWLLEEILHGQDKITYNRWNITSEDEEKMSI